ncbi:MAG TPA: hypothetical protein VMV52_00880 [Candidatus Nanopelagicaceae bacterium]|nr:hypothetical protein [Candidatus Nanopelagicaceae bacterium]
MILAPLPQNGVPLGRRLSQLYAGLTLYGASMALMIRGNIGLDPWDVFNQGLTRVTHLSFGTIVIVSGLLILLLWIPLRQRPGVGTISNVFVIGIAVDAFLRVVPDSSSGYESAILLLSGVFLNGLAGALYIGAGLGPGPRDGLTIGLVDRTGKSIRLIRTIIELSVLAIGWAMGGTVGIGTVAYALLIGPILHVLLPRFTLKSRESVEIQSEIIETNLA